MERMESVEAFGVAGERGWEVNLVDARMWTRRSAC